MSRRISISEKTARALLGLVSLPSLGAAGYWAVRDLRAAIDALPDRKRSSRVFHKSRKPTKAEKRDETAAIRAACIQRAGGMCECGCGREICAIPTPFASNAELDHFFGRGKAKQSVETCWILRADCHREKTNNQPDSETWFKRYRDHCARYGYRHERIRATSRLFFVATRSKLGAGLKERQSAREEKT